MNAHVNVTLTPAWRSWLIENLQRGCTHQSIIESMVKNNFTHAAATAHIAQVMAGSAKNTPLVGSDSPQTYQYEASRIISGNTISLTDHSVKVSLRLAQPDIVVFDNFMTTQECETLIALSTEKLQRSGVVDPETGKTLIIEARSSEGCCFQRGENLFIQQLEQRLSELMNWPIEHGEGIQILHYANGGEYRPHFDYFPFEQSGSATHLATGGQRVPTFIMYLNDVEAGGETIFPEVGLKVIPRQRSAAYFSYTNALGQVDPATLHGGAPVTAGEKWIATKWMRQRKY